MIVQLNESVGSSLVAVELRNGSEDKGFLCKGCNEFDSWDQKGKVFELH